MSDKFKFFSIIPDSTKEEALNPTSNLIGQAFRGIAHKILDPLVKYNIVKDAEMLDFAEKIQRNTDEIPLENRDDSMLGLTYKAIEDSSYRLNEEALREMFSNLIAATVDNRKNNRVKPSFSSILKDLTSEDAKLFQLLYKETATPIAEVRLQSSETFASGVYAENIILLNDYEIDNSASIDLLNRFGLINIRPTANLLSENYVKEYEKFEQSSFIKKLESFLPQTTDDIEFDKLKITRGSIVLTTTGIDFGELVIS